LNKLTRKTLLTAAALFWTAPVYGIPLMSAPPSAAVFAAEAAAPADDPRRGELLRQIQIFELGSGEMLASGTIHYSFDEIAEFVSSSMRSAAQDPNSTASRLDRAVRYVRFNLDDYIQKGSPNYDAFLSRRGFYFNTVMLDRATDAPGGYSEAKVLAASNKIEQLLLRIRASSSEVEKAQLYKEYLAVVVDFFNSPNL